MADKSSYCPTEAKTAYRLGDVIEQGVGAAVEAIRERRSSQTEDEKGYDITDMARAYRMEKAVAPAVEHIQERKASRGEDEKGYDITDMARAYRMEKAVEGAVGPKSS